MSYTTGTLTTSFPVSFISSAASLVSMVSASTSTNYCSGTIVNKSEFSIKSSMNNAAIYWIALGK